MWVVCVRNLIFFKQYPKLMTTAEGWSKDQLVNGELSLEDQLCLYYNSLVWVAQFSWSMNVSILQIWTLFIAKEMSGILIRGNNSGFEPLDPVIIDSYGFRWRMHVQM